MDNSFDNKLAEVLQNEKFVAFFDFCLIGENGESDLDGICKVAYASYNQDTDFISFTFIFDTPTEGKRALAQRLVGKLTTESFKKVVPEVYAVTSVSNSIRHTENYIHNVDVMFHQHLGGGNELRELVKKLVYPIRKDAGLNTEVPQWWDEVEAPAPTEAEKANWGARIKALLGLKEK